MRLLLDTHVWLWMIGPSERIGPRTREALQDESTELVLSVAAIWEIGIKHAAGRLKLASPPSALVPTHIARSGVRPLPIGVAHALRAADLPMHHRDPFDRLMVAQALEDDLTFVTVDPRLTEYGVATLDARS
jgi:PIN domain nuclease of toxin-antitoxin system